MSNNGYIPLCNSPSPRGNYRGGRNNTPFRGFSSNHQQQQQRFGGPRNNYSPYNRGNQGRKSFNNGPRFDKPQDISAYYHPSMLQDPWAGLENATKLTVNNSPSLNSSSTAIIEESLDDSNSSFSKSASTL